MTNTKGIILLFTLATILITGGLTLTPAAYSSGNDDSNHDDSGCHDDSHGDCIPDPCDCKKPDTLKVTYTGPIVLDANGDEIPAIVQIFKEANGKKQVGDDIDVTNGETVMVTASMYGKDELKSKTFFQIVDPLGTVTDIEIHTSCSQDLYIGQVFPEGGGDVTLTVLDGTRNGETSIPISDPLTCEAPTEPKPTKFGSITLKKALTQDNTDEAQHVSLSEFHMFITNVTDPLNPKKVEITEENQIVDAGTYTLSETGPLGFNFVLVAGNTGCPSMVEDMEEFTIKEGEHLTCVIYNDDDRDAGEGGGGPGVIFHFDTIQFEVALPGTSFGRDCEVVSYVQPCVVIQGENSFVVRPDLSTASQDFSKSTLVMFTMVPEILTNASGCTLQGLTFNSTLNEIDGFSLQCTSTGIGNKYNVNFALVETMMP